MSSHWRDYVEEIKFFCYLLFGVLVFEGSLIPGDLHERMFESCFDVVAGCYFSQSLWVFWYSEHHSICLKKLNFDWQSFFAPFVSPKIQYFLRCSCAFNWHCRFSKNGFSSMEFLSKFSQFLSSIQSINWADIRARIIKHFLETLNFVILQL